MTTDTAEPATRTRGRAHTYDDAAKIFKVSKRQIIREVRSGRLKADKLSDRVIRIFDDQIDAYAELVRSERTQG